MPLNIGVSLNVSVVLFDLSLGVTALLAVQCKGHWGCKDLLLLSSFVLYRGKPNPTWNRPNSGSQEELWLVTKAACVFLDLTSFTFLSGYFYPLVQYAFTSNDLAASVDGAVQTQAHALLFTSSYRVLENHNANNAWIVWCILGKF